MPSGTSLSDTSWVLGVPATRLMGKFIACTSLPAASLSFTKRVASTWSLMQDFCTATQSSEVPLVTTESWKALISSSSPAVT